MLRLLVWISLLGFVLAWIIPRPSRIHRTKLLSAQPDNPTFGPYGEVRRIVASDEQWLQLLHFTPQVFEEQLYTCRPHEVVEIVSNLGERNRVQGVQGEEAEKLSELVEVALTAYCHLHVTSWEKDKQLVRLLWGASNCAVRWSRELRCADHLLARLFARLRSRPSADEIRVLLCSLTGMRVNTVHLPAELEEMLLSRVSSHLQAVDAPTLVSFACQLQRMKLSWHSFTAQQQEAFCTAVGRLGSSFTLYDIGLVLRSMGEMGAKYRLLSDSSVSALQAVLQLVEGAKKVHIIAHILHGLGSMGWPWEDLPVPLQEKLSTSAFETTVRMVRSSEQGKSYNFEEVASLVYSLPDMKLKWSTLPGPLKATILIGIIGMAKLWPKRGLGRRSLSAALANKDYVTMGERKQAIDVALPVHRGAQSPSHAAENELRRLQAMRFEGQQRLSDEERRVREAFEDQLQLELQAQDVRRKRRVSVPVHPTKAIATLPEPRGVESIEVNGHDFARCWANVLFALARLEVSHEELHVRAQEGVVRGVAMSLAYFKKQGLALTFMSLGRLGIKWKKLPPDLTKLMLQAFDEQILQAPGEERTSKRAQSLRFVLQGLALMGVRFGHLPMPIRQRVMHEVQRRVLLFGDLSQLHFVLRALAFLQAGDLPKSFKKNLRKRLNKEAERVVDLQSHEAFLDEHDLREEDLGNLLRVLPLLGMVRDVWMGSDQVQKEPRSLALFNLSVFSHEHWCETELMTRWKALAEMRFQWSDLSPQLCQSLWTVVERHTKRKRFKEQACQLLFLMGEMGVDWYEVPLPVRHWMLASLDATTMRYLSPSQFKQLLRGCYRIGLSLEELANDSREMLKRELVRRPPRSDRPLSQLFPVSMAQLGLLDSNNCTTAPSTV